MRWVLGAARAAVVVIACYFMVLWGGEALRALTSPTYGLDEFSRSQDVFGIGHWIGLRGEGLFRLAAFLAAFKLVGAGAFALHLASRVRAVATGKPIEHELLEAALLLVVLLFLFASLPAAMQHSALLLRFYGVHLLLASAAALLNGCERLIVLRMAATASEPSALDRAMDEARAELPPQRSSLLRRTGAMLDLFARRWTQDFRAVFSGERHRSV